MDSLVDSIRGSDVLSLGGDDSNTIIMPEKNNKKKRKNQVNEKLKENKTPKLSKSQKRKMKKLEEEKEKALLLSKSIETLQKYKIQEDVYALMRSSRNLGQVETAREKRGRAVQFSKIGLEIPYSIRPSKRKAVVDSSEEVELASSNNEANHGSEEDDSTQLVRAETEISSVSAFSSNCSQEFVPSKEAASENSDKSVLEDAIRPMSSNSCTGGKSANSMDGIDDDTKVSHDSTSDLGSSHSHRIPTVVHVSRPKDVEDKRKDLPIVMMEQEIMEAINENSSVIVCGETGCGKTTQVPQFLYEAGFGSSQSVDRTGIIGVTQPRRVAVLATAKRVAFELGVRLGREVGFQVRHDKRIGDNCSIKFMTDGILLREVQSDFLLRRYSIIILDEAHERSLNTDILIGMLSRVIRLRQSVYENQQKAALSGEKVSPENKIYPLRLVLMSATLRVEDFVSGRRIFRNPPPIIEVPTRQYPVTIHFSKKTEIVDYVGQAYKKALSIHKRLPPGGILIFVTGQREVEYLCRKLRATSMKIVEDDSKRNKTSFENSESDPNGEHDMREIDEAFDFRGDKNVISTDRFGSHDEDHDDLSEFDAFEDSYESGEESDLEVLSDGEDLPETKMAESLSIDSLKVAFEALSGNSSRKSDSTPFEGKTDEETNFGSGNKKMGTKNSCSNPGPMRVLPLYAMLPASSQLRVFEEVKEGERLVIVATNVAETSLTIPGIKYVVDTGREKVKNYNSSNGIETYEVEWISKASAAQRAGRAGRTGPGHCYRLYSSAVFCNIFDDFSSAEISKVPVDGVVLLMKSMNIDKVANFPFPTPPEASALSEAERCLRVLEALDANSKLTPLGKAMAKYPMSPRHSRMLLTVIQLTTKQSKPDPQKNLVLGFAVAAAAALSLSNPFVMQSQTDEKLAVLDNEEKSRKKKQKERAKTARAKFSNPTSDALSVSYALQCFELSENPAEFCNENCLHLKTMEEMSKLRKQLLRLVFNQNFSDLESEFSWIHGTIEEVESAWGVVSSDKNPLSLKDEGILREAIYAGWADRVAKRVRFSGAKEGEKKVNAVRYQACMVKETVFLHRWSSLSNSAPEYLVYNELLHTNRPYIHGATSVEPTWLVKYAESLCTLSNPLEDRKPYYDPSSDQVYCWVAPTFGPHLWNLPLHNSPVEGNLHRVAVFACALLEGQVLPCLRSYQKFMAASPASIVRPEATGNKRAGNLLNAMNSKIGFIDSCEKLRKAWKENRHFLYSEILEWFQEGFRDRFDGVWSEMHREVLLDHRERFSKRIKREKRRNF